MSFDYFLFHVFIPKGRYSGQNRISPVRTNTPASTNNRMANVPVITCVKYRTVITKAANSLTALSMIPTFAFISSGFKIVLFVVFILSYSSCYLIRCKDRGIFLYYNSITSKLY